MRSLSMLAAVAALSLSACMGTVATAPPGSTSSTPPPAVSAAAGVADAVGAPAPASFADRTTIDESVGLGFETAVAAAADLATLGVKTKVVHDSKLVELRERVAWARVTVGSVRAAYDAGNAASYKAAVNAATCAIARIRTLASGQADKPCPVAKLGEVR